MIDKIELQKRIEEMTARRDEFLAQANREISFMNGKIEAWQELIQETKETKETVDTVDNEVGNEAD